MVSSSLAFVASERAALADLFEEVGPDAPTCCAGWTTAHLPEPVVVCDRRPARRPRRPRRGAPPEGRRPARLRRPRGGHRRSGGVLVAPAGGPAPGEHVL